LENENTGNIVPVKIKKSQTKNFEAEERKVKDKHKILNNENVRKRRETNVSMDVSSRIINAISP
jgi:hypothetical protein